jgi:CSLREA domain-containing protein
MRTSPVFLSSCHILPTRRALAVLAVVIIALGGVALQPRAASAADIPVNTPVDDIVSNGNCTLREAIQAANTDSVVDACAAGSGADTVILPAGVYTLTIPGVDEDANQTGDLDITGTLTIRANATTINASGLDRALHAQPGEYTVTVQGLTITNGADRSGVLNAGGGAWFQSHAVLSGTHFISNTALEGGGALFARTATLTSTGFIRNVANIHAGGAAFEGDTALYDTAFVSNTAGLVAGGATFRAPAALLRTRFEGNRGGSTAGGAMFDSRTVASDSWFIANEGPTGGATFARAEITNTRFISNIGDYSGGALFFGASSVHSSTFAGNRSVNAGGAAFWSEAKLRANLFYSNTAYDGSGGGASFTSEATLQDDRFEYNVASQHGGGAHFAVTATLQSVRFEGNQTTTGDGGGLLLHGAATVSNTLIISNSAGSDGGGVHIDSAAALDIVNTLFAANQAGERGAAVHVQDAASLLLVHNTIASPALLSTQAVYVHSGTVFLTNTIVASHSVGIERAGGFVHEDYSLFAGNTLNRAGGVISGGNSRAGNAGFVNPVGTDYHLAAGSHAIDNGVATVVRIDIDGDSRPLRNCTDIGFDEHTPAPACRLRTYLPALARP